MKYHLVITLIYRLWKIGMMNLNFQQLQCFVTVSETLNFSTAAKRLHLSQPAVSKNIKQLETELSFELFRRSQHEVSLTAAGLEFSKQMANVLILTEQAIIDSREISEQEKASLKIGYTNAMIEISCCRNFWRVPATSLQTSACLFEALTWVRVWAIFKEGCLI